MDGTTMVALSADSSEGSGGTRKKGRPRNKNVKFTISLSPKSVEVLQELKELTDASTDSEAFRNALRLHLALVRAHFAGKKLLIRDEKAGDVIIPVTLFTP
jgi:hypothetical protein